MKRLKRPVISACCLVWCWFVSAIPVFADNPYTTPPSTLNPPTPTEDTISTEKSLEDFLVSVINFALGFLGIVALLFFIYGGYLWITALGKDEQITKAKNIMTGAVIGIFIILGSYALVYSILNARQFLLPV